jgi:hypothetical protein
MPIATWTLRSSVCGCPAVGVTVSFTTCSPGAASPGTVSATFFVSLNPMSVVFIVRPCAQAPRSAECGVADAFSDSEAPGSGCPPAPTHRPRKAVRHIGSATTKLPPSHPAVVASRRWEPAARTVRVERRSPCNAQERSARESWPKTSSGPRRHADAARSRQQSVLSAVPGARRLKRPSAETHTACGQDNDVRHRQQAVVSAAIRASLPKLFTLASTLGNITER